MKSLKIINRFFPLLMLLFVSNSLWAQKNITGLNVGYVKEKYRTTVTYIWLQTGKTVWTRTQSGLGAQRKFIEEKREKDGVTLKLVGNIKERIKIDLRQKTVFNLTSGAAGKIIATGPSKYGAAVITNNTTKPKAKIKANGQTVTYATFSKNGRAYGSLKQIGPKKWAEYKGSRKDHEFTETRRGPWSVFLTDKTRGVSITVNLHTKKVLINNRPEYDVSYADARSVPNTRTSINGARNTTTIKANGQTVTYATFSKNGRAYGSLKQIGPKKWAEYKGSRKDHEFTEIRRGPWSVFLTDKTRGVSITINLHTKKVLINNRPEYDVSYADARSVRK